MKVQNSRQPIPRLSHWLAGDARVRRRIIRGLAGHRLTIDATDILGPDRARDKQIAWKVAGKRRPGSVLEWSPASPGPFRAHIEIDGHSVQTVPILVGLRPQDLLDRRARLNFFFCLIVRSGAKVSFVPLFAPGARRDEKSSKHRRDRAALKKEVALGHPGFVAWTKRQSAIYRQSVLPRPFFDIGRVADGLYAVFPNDVVYLGGAPTVVAVAKEVKAALSEVRTSREGGGLALRRMQKAVSTLAPFQYEYSKEQFFSRAGSRTRAANKFVFNAVAPLVGAASRFAASVGSRIGPNETTAIVTFNALNGTIGTRVIDSELGISRNLVSGFDVLLTGSQLASLGSNLSGRGVDPASFCGFTSRAQSFGTDATGALTALGLSGLGRVGGNAAAAADGGESSPASDVKANGVDMGGKIWVQGSDGSTVGFSKDANGDPVVHVIGTTDDGGVIVTGDETIIDFTDGDNGDDDQGGFGGEDPEGGGGDGGGNGNGNGGEDGSGGTDGGDGTDGGAPDGGSGGDDGSDGGTDGGGGDDGSDGGTDGGDDSGGSGPSGGDPTASMPAPDDGGGDGGGDGEPGGGQTSPGGRGSGRGPSGDPVDPDGGSSTGRPIVLGHVGVITAGGGYTDPMPDDGTGGGDGDSHGSIRIVPGGGVADPPEENGAGGFDYWGTFHPPSGGGFGVDPTLAALGSYGRGAGVSRTTRLSGGSVSVTEYSGADARGVETDGLVGTTMAERGRGPRP